MARTLLYHHGNPRLGYRGFVRGPSEGKFHGGAKVHAAASKLDKIQRRLERLMDDPSAWDYLLEIDTSTMVEHDLLRKNW